LAAGRHRARVDDVAGVDRQVVDRLQVRAVGKRARQSKRQIFIKSVTKSFHARIVFSSIKIHANTTIPRKKSTSAKTMQLICSPTPPHASISKNN
ncbi:hypothetical protein, partial [Burkholderia sp. BDU5]|uniref:hypothetical protein n=1 Tax=Burkholderia sp. BDU5 TaxID=1385590 RepID=UPI0018D243E0